MLITAIVFIIILGLLVFVHELGHFLMAKRSGIKVEEFAFGFPPRIFAIKRGETEYAINLLPIGGYVRMLGEDEDATKAEKSNPRSFAHQSPWVRSKVVVAGVVMNVILAWLLVSIGFMLGMSPLVSEADSIPRAKVTHEVAISGVLEGSVASEIGLKPGDAVLSINDTQITSQKQLIEYTTSNRGKDIKLVVDRKGEQKTFSAVLGSGEYPLGAALVDQSKAKLPIWWAPIYAIWETLKAVGLIFVAILDFFRQLFVSRAVPEGAAGPVGLFQLTRTILDYGFAALLSFAAMISINLAIVNILPIPALDGGRLLFIILEKINKGKKVVNAQIENAAHTVGFVLLILLIIAITYSDILKLRG